MGMPGRGVMFVGEEGVLVTAFYGGSPWLPDHTVAKPGANNCAGCRRAAAAGAQVQGVQAAGADAGAVRAGGPLRGLDQRVQGWQEVDAAD